jgi:hypothetical protein
LGVEWRWRDGQFQMVRLWRLYNIGNIHSLLVAGGSMRTRSLAMALLLFCNAQSALAQASASLAQVKLIRATNYVQELRARHGKIATEEAIFATKLACDALHGVLKDDDFRGRVSNVAAAADEYKDRNAAIRADLGRFLDEFLTPELVVLESAGLSSASVAQIVKDAFELQAHAYIGKYGRGSDQYFLRNVTLLTDEICRAAAQAQIIAEGKKSDILFRVGVALGGVVVVLADVYLTPTPTGLLAVQSYSFGSALVAGAILK